MTTPNCSPTTYVALTLVMSLNVRFALGVTFARVNEPSDPIDFHTGGS